jgi:CheY-like chemotaxis protein
MTTVLVVDDEALIAMALQAALEDEGYQVVTAANGRQGLERLAAIPRPELVLLDMMMPVMSGPEMLRTMQADPALGAIPVIVLSSLPREAVQARTTGVAAILRKPYTVNEVLGVIAQVLGQAGENAR